VSHIARLYLPMVDLVEADLGLATCLLQLQPAPNPTTHVSRWLLQVTFDRQWDLLGFTGYDSEAGAVVVAFRGTDSHSWGNWVNNLKTWRLNTLYPVPGAPPGVMVHAGAWGSLHLGRCDFVCWHMEGVVLFAGTWKVCGQP
jgi:hypothetical protein